MSNSPNASPASAPTPPAQILTSGLTPSQKYGTLGGFTGHRMIPPPGKTTILCLSLAGHGKTSFWASHPGAYIFNLDLSSFSAYDPPAMFWPALDPLGRGALNDAGNPFVLEYKPVRERIDLLKKMATDNSPRPETIVIDTLTSLFRMILADRLKAAGMTSIRQVHGPTYYDEIYTEIANIIVDLRAHGYGVCLNAHLKEVEVTVGESAVERQVRMAMTDNFFGRLSDIWESVIIIEARKKSVLTPDPRFPDDRRRDIRSEVPVHYLTFNHPNLTKQMKTRLRFNIPEIEIPLGMGWETFAAQYMLAANAALTPSLHPPRRA